MSEKPASARLDLLLRESAQWRRSAEDVSARHHALLDEHRRLFRGLHLAAKLARLPAPGAAPPRPGPLSFADRESQNLASADRHIVEGEARVARQRDMIDALRRDGYDTALAEALLAVFLRTLDAWQAHRNAIAGAVEPAE